MFDFRSAGWMLGAAVIVLLASTAALAADTTFVPLRWCAVDGTPAVTNPAGAPLNPYNMMPEPDTDNVLWRRHERASDQIMIPGADISYRSGITVAVLEDASFPVIPDPCPPTTQPVCQGGSTAGFSCTPDGGGGAPECDPGIMCATQVCPAQCTWGCPGTLGDVHSPTPICQTGAFAGSSCNPNNMGQDPTTCGAGVACASDLTEYNLVITSCTAAWDTLTGTNSTNLLGQVAVNAGIFVDINGTRTGLKGRAQRSIFMGNSCAMPPTGVTSATGGAMVVIDNQNYVPADIPFEQLNERLTAHELGHTLELWHGDGMDNDMDNGYDQVCDPMRDEEPTVPLNWCLTPLTFMSSTGCGALSTNMTGDQRNTARALAAVYSGATNDPPGVLEPGPNQGDQRSDPAFDVEDRAVDIVWLAIQENSDVGRTNFVHRLSAPIPETPGVHRRYQVYADMDNNPMTGGAPRDLGFDTDFEGAELVTDVEVFLSGVEFPTLVALGTVWTFVAGAFEECNPREDPSCDVAARLFPILGGDDGRGIGEGAPTLDAHAVVIEMSNELRGPMGQTIRIQALAEVLGSEIRDRLPDPEPSAPLQEGTLFRPEAPEFPACLVTPGMAAPGERAMVEADPLTPGEMAKIFVGDLRAGGGLIGDDGVAQLEFRVPIESTPGRHLVTVGVVGTALTADCTVDVEDGPPVRISPLVANNPPGTEHTALAIVFDENGEPVEGEQVDLAVVDGPNMNATGTCDPGDCMTDEFGRVFFRYQSAGAVGVDRIEASIATGETSNTSFKFWDNDCNANGIADTCDVDCGGFGGLCGEVIGCGASADANTDGVPDECNLPPDCSEARAHPAQLWPPNHKLVAIQVQGVTDPDDDPVSIMVTSIAQDEPVENKADGATQPDAFGLGTSNARVRAERQGSGDGRVYHINFLAEDELGGQCEGEVTVCVPKSRSPKHAECVDGGAVHDSTIGG